MSLVLEALRRVEKPEARPGSVGVAVASYRPKGRRRGLILPLALGLGTGAVLLFVFPAPSRTSIVPGDERPRAEAPSMAPPRSEPAATPAPEPVEPASRRAEVQPAARALPVPVDPPSPAPKPRGRGPAAPEEPAMWTGAPRPPLVLQAISERDSRPIAVISDQLVREGDVFEGARILSIGPESVDVVLEDGQKATLRFLPPPPVGPSPSPVSR